MPKSASCAFSSDSESAHASIRSSVASQLPVSRNSKPLTGAQSPPLQIHSERIHRIVVRFRAEVGHHWVFAGELCGPQESRGKATHLPRLSEIPPLVNSPGENLSARFLHSQFRFRVALGEPNSKRVNSTAPAVNGFPAQRRFKSTSHNVQFCKGFGSFCRRSAILRFGNWCFGRRVQPSGLRSHPAFSAFELSHSLVNTTP